MPWSPTLYAFTVESACAIQWVVWSLSNDRFNAFVLAQTKFPFDRKACAT
jgi:hypothetical protein